MNCKNILVINQDSRDIRYDCEGSFPDQPMDIASKSEKKMHLPMETNPWEGKGKDSKYEQYITEVQKQHLQFSALYND